MLRVAGKPILEHTIKALPKEVNEVILVIGYLGNQIKKYFGNKFDGKKIKYVWQKKLRGTFNALTLARPYLKKQFLVLLADDLYDKKDLEKLIKYDLAILAYESKNPERFGVCVGGKNNLLKKIIEKPENPPCNLVNIGVYKLNHDIFKEPLVYINGEQFLPPMIGSLAEKKKINIVKARFWHPIGYKEDLDAAERILSSK